ncbi:MAG: phosphatidylglycerophosphatase A [Pseudomonadota bacterium]|jgi:phosphatidylglycerophosphatase A|nr:phosphatidylglycerophosphatase A [Pseudomonadota bacterium]
MRKTIKKLFIHLEHFLATGFGTGHSPVAPGTIGTAVGVIVFLPILSMPFSFQIGFVISSFFLGVWITSRVASDMGIEDPPEIVFDEFVGIWVALLGLKNLFLIVPAFIIFRLLDIFKPWPISFLDREIRAGWGIMLDDLAAGAIVFFLIQSFFWFPHLIS